MLESVPAVKQDYVACNFRAARQEIDAGIVKLTATEQRKYWKHWAKYTGNLGIYPYLHKTTLRGTQGSELLPVWLAGSGQVSTDWVTLLASIQVALRTIAKKCELERGFNPTYQAPWQYIAPARDAD